MMQPTKGKHERPKNKSSVNLLFKIASKVHVLYRPYGGPLYLRYISCSTPHREGLGIAIKIIISSFIFNFMNIFTVYH